MVSWSRLPPEIKHLVVENADFLSRIALKSASRLDRQIVLSTKCHIPRVRFGYKQGKCLVVIYTGIEQFLRMEIEKCEKGVVVYKTQNSYHREDATRKFVPSADVLSFGFSILRAFTDESISISAIEWDVSNYVADATDSFGNLKCFLKTYRNVIGFRKFRVKEMVNMSLSEDTLCLFFKDVSVWQELECVRVIRLKPAIGCLHPVIAYDLNCPFEGKPIYDTVLSTVDSEQFRFEADFVYNNQHFLSSCANVESGTFRVVLKSSRNPAPPKRSLDGSDVIWKYESTCGNWSHVMPVAMESRLVSEFHAQKCGLGFLCAQHADPFDYWYYQNLPRRMIQEPFWQDVVCPFEVDPDYTEFKNQLTEAEQTKKRTQTAMSTVETAVLTVSKYSEGVVEAPDSEDVKPVPDEFEDVKISESSCLKSFLIFFIFPVLLSFIFYALFN